MALRCVLAVNGETRQDWSLSEMIYDFDEALTDLSPSLTLRPGDMALLDGTAAAVPADHTVIRGPADNGGRLRRYTPAERAALIDGADLAVFTTRHDCARAVLEGAVRLRGVCAIR